MACINKSYFNSFLILWTQNASDPYIFQLSSEVVMTYILMYGTARATVAMANNVGVVVHYLTRVLQENTNKYIYVPRKKTLYPTM